MNQSEAIPTPNPKYKKIDAKKLHKLADSINAHREEPIYDSQVPARRINQSEALDSRRRILRDTVYEQTKDTDKTLAIMSEAHRYAKVSNLALLNRIEEGLPKMWVITEQPDEYARQKALGHNQPISEIKQILQKERERL